MGFDIIEADTTKRTNIKIILEEEREYVKNEVLGRPLERSQWGDSYGPAVREEISFEEKVKRFAEIGFSAIQFHDDDVVPNMNDQNGIRYDQDKSFGVENLRAAFDQVKVLKENNYGEGGEFVGLDVKAMRTTKDKDSYKHLENSLKIFKMLEEKVEHFDYDFQRKCVENRDFEALEIYVMELLIGAK